MSPDQERTLVSEIYAAGLDPLRWPHVMERLGRAYGEVKTHIFGYRSGGEIVHVNATWGYEPSALEAFGAYYGRMNPWAPGFVGGPIGRAIPARQMLADDELKKTEFYHDWVLPIGNAYRGGGIVLAREPGGALLFGGNLHEKDAEYLEPLWLDLVNRVAPAIRQAVEVSRRLAGLTLENLLLRSGVAPEGAAVVLLARNRRILHANPLAESLLAQGRLLRTTPLGALAPLPAAGVEQTFAKALQALFQSGRGTEPFGLNAQTTARLLPVDTSVIPLAPFGPLWRESGTVAMLLVTTKPESAGATGLIMSTLGLTESEAAVAEGITDGQTPAELALARQTSIHTIRNQLKSALFKTGSRRQSELAVLIERLRRS